MKKHQIPPQIGMSLIELMIAMVLGMIVVAGVLYMFQSSRQTFRYSETMGRMQENGRLALESIANDLRLTSYAGCGSISSLHPQSLVSSPTITFDEDNVVAGRAYTSSDPLVGASGAASSDIITVKHMAESVVKLNAAMVNKSDDIVLAKTAATPKFVSGQIASIANCQGMDIFRVTGVTEDAVASTITISHAQGPGTTGNTQADLNLSFKDTNIARFARIVEQSYYVKNSGRTNSAGQAIFSLFRRATLNGDSDGTEEELAEGIEKLVVSYGLDSDDDGAINSYTVTSAMTSSDWAKVLSVRIELLVASVEDRVTDSAQAYTFNGSTSTPTDRKMRTSVGTTATLRNRIHY